MKTILLVLLAAASSVMATDLHLERGGMLSGEVVSITPAGVELATAIGRTVLAPAELTADTRARLGIGTPEEAEALAAAQRAKAERARFEAAMRAKLAEIRLEESERAMRIKAAKTAESVASTLERDGAAQMQILRSIRLEIIRSNLLQQAKYGPVWISPELARELNGR